MQENSDTLVGERWGKREKDTGLPSGCPNLREYSDILKPSHGDRLVAWANQV